METKDWRLILHRFCPIMKECREERRAAAACAVWSDVAGNDLVLSTALQRGERRVQGPAAAAAAAALAGLPQHRLGPRRAGAAGGAGRATIRRAQARAGAGPGSGAGAAVAAGSQQARGGGRGAGPACRRRSSRWIWGSSRRTTSLRSSRLKVPGGGGTGRDGTGQDTRTRQAAACRRDRRGLGRPGRAGPDAAGGRGGGGRRWDRGAVCAGPACGSPLPIRRARLNPAGPWPAPGRGCSAGRAAIERNRGARARLCGGVAALGTSRCECCVIVREGWGQVREKFIAFWRWSWDEGWKLSVRWNNMWKRNTALCSYF